MAITVYGMGRGLSERTKMKAVPSRIGTQATWIATFLYRPIKASQTQRPYVVEFLEDGVVLNAQVRDGRRRTGVS